MLAVSSGDSSSRRRQHHRAPPGSPATTTTTKRSLGQSRFHVDSVVKSTLLVHAPSSSSSHNHNKAALSSELVSDSHHNTSATGRNHHNISSSTSYWKAAIIKFKIRNFFFVIIGCCCATVLLISFFQVSARNVIPAASAITNEFDPQQLPEKNSLTPENKGGNRNLSSQNRIHNDKQQQVRGGGGEVASMNEPLVVPSQGHSSRQDSLSSTLREKPQQQPILEQKVMIDEANQRQQQQQQPHSFDTSSNNAGHYQRNEPQKVRRRRLVPRNNRPEESREEQEAFRDRQHPLHETSLQNNPANPRQPQQESSKKFKRRRRMEPTALDASPSTEQTESAIAEESDEGNRLSSSALQDEERVVDGAQLQQNSIMNVSPQQTSNNNQEYSSRIFEQQHPEEGGDHSMSLKGGVAASPGGLLLEERDTAVVATEDNEPSHNSYKARRGRTRVSTQDGVEASDANQQEDVAPSTRIKRGANTAPRTRTTPTTTAHAQEDFSTSQQLECPNVDQSYVNRMIYWKTTRESDYNVMTSYRQIINSGGGEAKYLTFELNSTSIQWNSRRRLLETMVALAFATGRTLVLPPKMTLITTMNEMSQAGMSPWLGFQDLLTLPSSHYQGVSVITMDQFLELEGTTGRLKTTPRLDRIGGTPLSPPNGYAHWDGAANMQDLWRYLQMVSYQPEDWDPQTCVLGIPATVRKSVSSSDEDAALDLESSSSSSSSAAALFVDSSALTNWMENIWGKHHGRPPPDKLDYQGRPTRVDAPAVERLRELVAERKTMCHYGQDLQHAKVLHLRGDALESVPFYSFVFLEDWKQDLVLKRLVRDQVRFRDDIVCAAAQVVDHLQAADDSGGGGGGVPVQFHGLHLLLRDLIKDDTAHFEEEDLNIAMSLLVEDLRKWIPPTSRLYVATDMDEQRDCFQILRQSYHLVFISYIESLLEGGQVKHVFFPMVEQLVLARAHTFVGSYPSTFSAYVNRLRGYYSTTAATATVTTTTKSDPKSLDLLQQAAMSDGSLASYYLSPKPMQKQMRIYQALRQPLGDLEYPVAWRDIDK